ncbi:hypothetical protein LTR36_006011 [Oleoguttula mirabilis]|uniref:Up-regulated during septation protein 1 domain-containing protein n=1 Tax=Oleoguttula mirabilis TaxID=1507867 RepID=A0AAV9JDY1_9PEZI|nr:hypothetical protein LTR36_006011 [Oleoguttula mirabilis]
MPRAVVKIQSAPRSSRWTLGPNDTSLYSPKALEAAAGQKQEEEVVRMQTNGSQYFDQREPPLPRYESYDGSQYSVAHGLDRASSQGGFNGVTGGGHYNEYDYNTPLEERASHQISLNTQLRAPNGDAVGHHLLYETAMLDSQAYELLDIGEVDALKKEQTRLNSRIEAASRKLALESKVKDAAQNLQRLYSVSSRNRPDTPQSPDSAKKSRSSLLGSKRRTSSSGSGTGQTLHQAEDELAASTRKVVELNDTVKGLLDRRELVERKLLRHTAAVLAEQASRAAQRISGMALTNGSRNGNHIAESHDEEDASSLYSPDEFDGIRDILFSRPSSAGNKLQKTGNLQKMQDEHEQQMASVQDRLEQLNEQLRHVIGEASRTRGVASEPERDHYDGNDDDPGLRLDTCFNRLESNLRTLEQEQLDVKAHYAHIQDSASTTQNAVEEQLGTLNRQLHSTLLLGADMQDMETLHEPPQATGHGYQPQLQYLAESLQAMEDTLHRHRAELDNAREAGGGASRAVEDAQAKAMSHAQKIGEYEATLGGLWEILQSGVVSRRPSTVDRDLQEEQGLPSPGLPSPGLKEDFSLQAFSAHVQHLFDRAQSAKAQQEILRRQIQQQRELNGKSDAEKDRQLTDLQATHEQLGLEHGAAQEELSRVMAGHAQAESEASSARSELMNVTNEFEGLKRTADAKQQEREETTRALQMHQGQAATLQTQIDDLEAQVLDLTDDARIFTVESDAKETEAVAKLAAITELLAVAVSDKEAAEQRHTDVAGDLEALESEVVRLSTELAMAKAELEGAYGSRAERAKEAQAAEVKGLGERNRGLEGELGGLRGEHESLVGVHEGLGVEHEGLRREFEGLRGTHEGLTTEHEGLRGSHERLNAEHDGLRDLHERLNAEHDGLRNLHERLGAEHETLRGTHEATLASLQNSHGQITTSASSKSDRAKLLERELEDMTNEYQELTRESIQLEKERGQLEDLIDGLRDRCEGLEAQVSDDRVRWLGLKSPGMGAVAGGGAAAGEHVGGNGREMTSTMVLRQEFKRMMRETRAEGVKLLRVSFL